MAIFQIKSIDGKLNGSSSFNYTDIKTPKSIEIDIEDVDYDDGKKHKVGRSSTGTMRRNKVAMKRTLKVTWGPLTTEELYDILHAIDPDDRVVKTKRYKWVAVKRTAKKTGYVTYTTSSGSKKRKKVRKGHKYTTHKRKTYYTVTSRFSTYVKIKYFDPYDNAYKERTFYCSSRTMPLYNKTLDIWESLAIDFIEK